MKGLVVKIIAGFLFILLVSCVNDNVKSKDRGGSEIERAIDDLVKNKVGLRKYIFKEGKTDTVDIDSLNEKDWKKELALFTDNAFNPKQVKRYSCDSLQADDVKTMEYKAKDKNIALQKFFKEQHRDGYLKMLMDVNKETNLYSIIYHLEYKSDEGYLIESRQNVKGTFDLDYRIEGKFKF